MEVFRYGFIGKYAAASKFVTTFFYSFYFFLFPEDIFKCFKNILCHKTKSSYELIYE
jgi:hypothetical protein